MNDSRTTDAELKETIDKTEHQLGETSETKLRNVDDNPNNDVEIDMDQEITLHDGTITTLAKEAEALNIAPDEYKKQFAEREADCYADKVELIREEQAEEQSAERAEEHEERAERSLENDAWERMKKRRHNRLNFHYSESYKINCIKLYEKNKYEIRKSPYLFYCKNLSNKFLQFIIFINNEVK